MALILNRTMVELLNDITKDDQPQSLLNEVLEDLANIYIKSPESKLQCHLRFKSFA